MKEKFPKFSRKQQQVVGVFCLIYGIWFGWTIIVETRDTDAVLPLKSLTPPEVPVYIDPPVDINTASYEELQLLPSIGPVLARRILVYREKHGPFHTADTLQKVHGIGPKTVQKLQFYFTNADS